MCGRVAVPQRDDILEAYNLKAKADAWTKDINVPPKFKGIPVVSDRHPDELDLFHWELIPFYTKQDLATGKPIKNYDTFNARYDHLFTHNTWKRIIGKQHCTVIVNGYYEWQVLDEWADEKKKKKKKQPHFIRAKDQDFTLFAGLWDTWQKVDIETGEIQKVRSCAVITHDAVEVWGEIHERMPAFLTPEGSEIWLNNELTLEERLAVIQPKHDDFLESFKINHVGDVEEFEHVVFK